MTTLSGWALTLCPSLDPNAPAPAVARADGGADTPATEAPGGVNVSVALDMANMTRMGPLGANVSIECPPQPICHLMRSKPSKLYLYLFLELYLYLKHCGYPTQPLRQRAVWFVYL